MAKFVTMIACTTKRSTVPPSLGQHDCIGYFVLFISFEIFLNSCGMSSSGNTETYGQPNPAGSFVENTIIVQYDPLVQEVWDQARKLRCTWYDYYEKSVTFRPFQVGRLLQLGR